MNFNSEGVNSMTVKETLIDKSYESIMSIIKGMEAYFDSGDNDREEVVGKAIDNGLSLLYSDLELEFSQEYQRKTEEKYMEIMNIKNQVIDMLLGLKPKGLSLPDLETEVPDMVEEKKVDFQSLTGYSLQNLSDNINKAGITRSRIISITKTSSPGGTLEFSAFY